MPIRVVVGKTGFVPERGTGRAAGLDLKSPAAYTVPARGQLLMNLDIKIATPKGTFGMIASKSSLSAKHSIEVGAGVIDEDYRGDVHVLLYNLSDTDFDIVAGRKIAQIIVIPVLYDDVTPCDALEETERNESGFGSTGSF